ncbi:GNAT family N-acetyltransferase [Paenibacillus sp.]|uniref:GNAT family N-acetyltransferase n=1 Tax=Paenibacillus sp. TaxID=58172 RepID=UPI0028112F43|nr:GNAT family N-acetyltransferase [Paenibacillus sp.]
MLRIVPMSEDVANAILRWTYEKPYDFYNNDQTPDAVRELLDSNYYALLDSNKEIVGFYCVGHSAQVPNDQYRYSENYLDVGVGMRPDLTGQGLGTAFFATVLSHMRQERRALPKRLTVAAFNLRAIRLYQKFGFTREAEFLKGRTRFIVMAQTVESAYDEGRGQG